MHRGLLLDRDGVINVDHGYVHQQDDFQFVDGIFDLCRRFQQQGYKIAVVTNQAGIAYGLYTEEQFQVLSQWMCEAFSRQGIDIAGVYYCPHHPDKGHAPYRQTCECRKPGPGMLLQAARELELDLTQSCMIGDKLSDMQAAEAAGVGRKVLLASRYHQELPPPSVECVTSLEDIRLG